jgi:hypothetical protein
MNKYVFVYPASDAPPSEEGMKAWTAWFDSISASVVDGGNPFAGGVVTGPSGARALASGDNPAGGYSIVNAPNIDAAVALLGGCPIESGIRVYEAVPM